MDVAFPSTTVGDQAATCTSSDESRLMRLPAELRNFIYVHLASWTLCDTQFRSPPGILFASKRLRAEFLHIFYSEHDFRIHVRDRKRQTWTVVASRALLHALPQVTDWKRELIIFRPMNFGFDLRFAMDEVNDLVDEDRGVRFREPLHRGVLEIVESHGARCAMFAVRESVLARCGVYNK